MTWFNPGKWLLYAAFIAALVLALAIFAGGGAAGIKWHVVSLR